MDRKNPPSPPALDATPPPAFPGWLRRLDPTLEAEDSNELYQAFRRRRIFHQKTKFSHSLIDRVASWNLVLFLQFPAIIFVTQSPLKKYIGSKPAAILALTSFTLFLLFLTFSFFAKKLTKNKGIDLNCLPSKLHDIFLTNNVMTIPATDLWMCGVKGSEVAEAFYLEHKSYLHRFSKLVYFIQILVPICIYTYFRGLDHWTGIIVMITIVFFLREMKISSLREAPKNYYSLSIFPLVNNWRPETLSKESGFTEGKITTILIWFFCLGLPLLLLSCLFGGYLIDFFRNPDPLSSNFLVQAIFPDRTYILDLVGVGIAIGLIFYSRNYYKGKEPHMLIPPEDKEEIDDAFDHYIRTTVLRDSTD